MASPTYQGNGGIAYSSSDTVTPAYPTLQANDILILQIVCDTNNTHNAVSGWTKVTQRNQGTGASASWYWKRAVGDESGNLTVTQSAAGDIWAVISCWRGCLASGTPFELEQETSGNGPNNIVSSSITPTVDETRIVCLLCVEDNTFTGPLDGGNYATDFEIPDTNSSDAELAANSFAQATAANEPVRTGVVGNDDWITFTFALLPPTGANQINFADTLALTSLTSIPLLFKSIAFSDTLGLTSLTSDAKLHLIKVFADTLNLTSLTSDPSLSGLTVDFSDTLALDSLTSAPELFKQVNFSDTLALDSLTSAPLLYGIFNFSDTLALDSLTSTPVLFKSTVFADTLGLTSLTSDAKLYLLKVFADTLNLTSLTSDAELSGLTIDFSDTLNLTSLTSAPLLKILTNFADILNLTSLTSDAKLAMVVNFAKVLGLTSRTSSASLQIVSPFDEYSEMTHTTTGNKDPDDYIEMVHN
jgi:hypothetical protein